MNKTTRYSANEYQVQTIIIQMEKLCKQTESKETELNTCKTHWLSLAKNEY